MESDKTYWLYFNNKPLQAVRLHRGADDDEVRSKALQDVALHPYVFCEIGETPLDRNEKIVNSSVKQY